MDCDEGGGTDELSDMGTGRGRGTETGTEEIEVEDDSMELTEGGFTWGRAEGEEETLNERF